MGLEWNDRDERDVIFSLLFEWMWICLVSSKASPGLTVRFANEAWCILKEEVKAHLKVQIKLSLYVNFFSICASVAYDGYRWKESRGEKDVDQKSHGKNPTDQKV
jgi:hypothetical protein